MPLPPEIVDHIIDLVDSPWALQECSLVAKSWVGRSRMRLFRDVVLYSNRRWQRVMPVGNASPAVYTRTLIMGQDQNPWINTEPFIHSSLTSEISATSKISSSTGGSHLCFPREG